jgi:hypothetical protein
MPLTVPESIDSGIGPECNKRMLEKSISILKDLGVWNDSMSYDDNLRAGLLKNPAIWNTVYMPEGFEKQDDFKGHRILARLKIF